MNPEVVPRAFRILMWVVALAVFALIALTGYIAIQVQEIDKEVSQLRQTE